MSPRIMVVILSQISWVYKIQSAKVLSAAE